MGILIGGLLFAVTVHSVSAAENGPGGILSPVPGAAVLVDVSKAVNVAGRGANPLGVYPVRVVWEKPADSSGLAAFDIYRSGNRNSGFRKINPRPVDAAPESGGRFVYYDDDPQAAPGKVYYYRVRSLNSQGKGSDTPIDETVIPWDNKTAGWGALTHERYFLEYNKTIKTSHGRLTLMHKPKGIAQLGAETGSGAVDGYVDYNAYLSGLGAAITMRYENYVESYIEDNPGLGPYFRATGYTNTKVDMASRGRMSGTMVCTGMYPGKVYYGKLEIVDGGAGGGVYGVEPKEFPRGEVNWIWGTK
jgi:hypothetical protein